MANISQAVANSNSSLDLVSSKYLKSRVEESRSQKVGIRSHTGGHPVTINVGKQDESKISTITIEQARIIQVEADLSDKKMGNVFKNLRLQLGRRVIEPGLKENLVSEKLKFEKFFSLSLVNFKGGDDKWITRPLVFCNDLVGFIKELLNLRSLRADDVQVKVGLDGGKGHLKLILSLYQPDNLQVNKRGHSRVTRDLGIGCGPDFSLLDRKKTMILATTPDTPENYFNIEFINDVVGMNQVN